MKSSVKKMKVAVLVAVVTVVSVAACSHPETETITVFAASSLVNAFQEIGEEFEKEQAEAGVPVSVRFSFLSSATAATQIIEGSPADLFASANRRNIDRITRAGRVQNVFLLAENGLAVAAFIKGDLQNFGDIAKEGTTLILAAPQVPAGEYAREVLLAADRSGIYGAGFYDRVMENVVSEEPNARAVLAKVQLGEADAAIVYSTDILAAGDSVKHIPLPEEFNQTADYWVATLTENNGRGEYADAFLSFATSDRSRVVLRKHGFSVSDMPDTDE